jgi:hypothetical protein
MRQFLAARAAAPTESHSVLAAAGSRRPHR